MERSPLGDQTSIEYTSASNFNPTQ